MIQENITKYLYNNFNVLYSSAITIYELTQEKVISTLKSKIHFDFSVKNFLINLPHLGLVKDELPNNAQSFM